MKKYEKIITVIFATLLITVIMLIFMLLDSAVEAEASIYHLPTQNYSPEDVEMVAQVMWLENAHTGKNPFENMMALYLTGAVLVNRARYCKWCPDTIEACLFQTGQYASHTRINVNKHKLPKYVYMLARLALEEAYKTPENLIYQSQQPRLGKQWKVIDGEYFSLE